MSRLDECPHCGAQFKRGRPACPECGSDARTGWASSEEIDYRSVEIPDAWDEERTGTGRRSRTWVVAVVLAIVGILVWVLFRI